MCQTPKRYRKLWTGWWFGTSILFSHINWVSNHPLIDFLIFFRGVAKKTTKQETWKRWEKHIIYTMKPFDNYVRRGDPWQIVRSVVEDVRPVPLSREICAPLTVKRWHPAVSWVKGTDFLVKTNINIINQPWLGMWVKQCHKTSHDWEW